MNMINDIDFGLVSKAFSCTQHGLIQLSVPNHVEPFCTKCSDEGKEELDRKEQQKELKSKIGLPKMFLGAELKNFTQKSGAQEAALTQVSNYVRDIIGGSGRNLVIYGTTGAGKTHLACGVLNVCVKHKIGARYLTSYSIAQRIRASWTKTATETEKQVIESTGFAGVLLIDDVGVSDKLDTDYWSSIINNRYASNRPTIITTNLEKAELKALMGDRAYDRLTQKVAFVKCVWGSYRQTTADVWGD
jgi:DNA replication protein DnaC